jgi:bis(5'-nucleosyl)-tetraphosphatase (symmetrical)
MPTYAVGDIQGCFREFDALLEALAFDPERDRLWLVGDLINRGPQSLEVLRRVRDLGAAAVCVLGNHELHLLAVHYGGHTPRPSDTFDTLRAAPDFEVLCEWIRGWPMLAVDRSLGFALVHAGIPHIWDLEQAEALAREVEDVIRGETCTAYFAGMYGNRPDRWRDDLRGLDRWRVITNYLTRMRMVDKGGRLELGFSGRLDDAPAGLYPWYQLRQRRPLPVRIVFGHWAALGGVTDDPGAIGLDTGCVWGGTLTALCLESGEFTRIPAH